ncbi:hypothetical protein HYV74_03880 [Candidatus Uhrbacteria bacterium]|nr:hypothetical protein [Candidatus Uhrbacteria bacterium]
MDASTKRGCACPHHLVPAVLITLLGLLFLLGNLNVLSVTVVDIGWPILVIIGGLTKLMERRCRCC